MKKSIYTRTGDTGMTSLVGGHRVKKTHARLEAYGSVDELNSQIGLLASYIEKSSIRRFLQTIQSRLFVIGSYLATDTSATEPRKQSTVTGEMVAELEQAIDRIDSELPPLRLFVLPGGTRCACVCHVCRTICRRAERRILALQDELEQELDANVIAYINRLSDYFFVFARQQNIFAGHEEIVWKRTASGES